MRCTAKIVIPAWRESNPIRSDLLEHDLLGVDWIYHGEGTRFCDSEMIKIGLVDNMGITGAIAILSQCPKCKSIKLI